MGLSEKYHVGLSIEMLGPYIVSIFHLYELLLSYPCPAWRSLKPTKMVLESPIPPLMCIRYKLNM